MILRAGLLAALLSSAPLQCGHTPEAELQEDETPGDALWRLAQKFRDRHDGAAERQTLEYLVERYPASRWVAPAREELAKLAPGQSEPDGGG
jgi:outer membrane protein assembly factor BamD (BamD/ComL family)